jgi:hypothetical protein
MRAAGCGIDHHFGIALVGGDEHCAALGNALIFRKEPKAPSCDRAHFETDTQIDQGKLLPLVGDQSTHTVAEIPAFLAIRWGVDDVAELRLVRCLVSVVLVNLGEFGGG